MLHLNIRQGLKEAYKNGTARQSKLAVGLRYFTEHLPSDTTAICWGLTAMDVGVVVTSSPTYISLEHVHLSGLK